MEQKKKKKGIEQYNFCKGYLKSNLILIPQNFFFFSILPHTNSKIVYICSKHYQIFFFSLFTPNFLGALPLIKKKNEKRNHNFKKKKKKKNQLE